MKIPATIKPYIEEIAQCLWSKNASIMIGAGFSMNAQPHFDNVKKFPNWQELGNVFFRKVRGEDIQHAKYNFFDPLKLAYEVEANFGRAVLDNLLRENIPDSDHKPSKLHYSLLNLPWTDVFTTNYDTLLERAADSVSERNYKVIVNKEDLIHSVSPRIVKLHGCFAASTPLIINEEDYRTYPTKFAPFVNTVQQALLENTLCLIGFSGDDPNFLKWIGWIRDNLGEKNSPKIYLIGVLGLTPSQEKTLSQYNITSVDLSLCEGVEGSHYNAIKLFIDYCTKQKNSERVHWDINKGAYSKEINEKKIDFSNLHNELVTTVQTWQQDRQSYPGWLVAPKQYREVLWNRTSNWHSLFTLNSDELDFKLVFCFLYEFLWRKEKSLIPIFDHEVDFLEKYLISWESYEDDAEVTREKAFFITIALLRYFREEGKNDSWLKFYRIAKSIAKTLDEKESLTNQYALFLLFENESVKLFDVLSKWNTESSSPYWMYRKASILAEVGECITAKENLEKALIRVRKKINNSLIISSYSNVSLESYILTLLDEVCISIKFKDRVYEVENTDYSERLDDLKQFECDPRLEKYLLTLNINHEPAILKSVTTKSGFDIGSKQTVQHYMHDNKEYIDAFRFLKFCEDAGIPFRLPHVAIAKSGAQSAIKRLSFAAPYWSMVTMIRTHDEKSIELLFTRECLSDYDLDFVDKLANKYLTLLNRYTTGKGCLYEYGLFLPEALSRMCSKSRIETRDRILELLILIYKQKNKNKNFSNINKLFKRLLNSYNHTELFERLPVLVDLSCELVSEDYSHYDRYSFPNPISYISLKEDANFGGIKINPKTITSLIASLHSEVSEVRGEALITLNQLFTLKILNKTQIKSFKTNLLKKLDNYGLPITNVFYKFYFLELFNCDKTLLRSFKEYLLSTSPQSQSKQKEPKSFGLSDMPDAFTVELSGSFRYVNWEVEELEIHVKKILAWWESDKNIVEKQQKADVFGFDVQKEMWVRFSKIVECLYKTVVNFELKKFRAQLSNMCFEFEEKGFNSLYLKAVLLSYLELNATKFYNELGNALASEQKDIMLDAFRAINHLINVSGDYVKDILGLLSNFMMFSNSSLIIHAIKISKVYFKKDKELFRLYLEASILNLLEKTDKGYEQFSFDERLELRVSVGELACLIFNDYQENGQEIPSSILELRELQMSENEFSDRNIWN